jgi:alkaline phosphatase
MKKNLTAFIIVISILSLTACSNQKNKVPEIRNVVLMIGDGMGLSTVYAAMSASDHPLNFERCEYIGLQKTSSADHYVTDSSAGGTALATGEKTNNYMLGVDPDGKKLKSILEIAEEHGLSTGLVSTSSITHATPASFIAHVADRNSYEDIAMDFLKTDIDVFIGGGYNNFVKRKDNLNLADSLKARGYEVATTMNEILESTSLKLAGFTAPVHNPYRLKGRNDMLSQASEKALSILSKNPEGFFLMIEGSEIDFIAHVSVADTLIDETLDFDDAIGKVLDFAKEDGHTLVIITADHETGGVAIIGKEENTNNVNLVFATKDHSAVMVPVFAFGPGAELFTGIYQNTDIFKKMLKSFGFQEEQTSAIE